MINHKIDLMSHKAFCLVLSLSDFTFHGFVSHMLLDLLIDEHFFSSRKQNKLANVLLEMYYSCFKVEHRYQLVIHCNYAIKAHVEQMSQGRLYMNERPYSVKQTI